MSLEALTILPSLKFRINPLFGTTPARAAIIGILATARVGPRREAAATTC